MRTSPQELVDYVIHFLRHDTASLAAARLVCRAWNRSASVHLFRSLDLMFSEPPPSAGCHHNLASSSKSKSKAAAHRGVERFKSLLTLLQTSVVIPRCVREVTLGRTTQLRGAENHEKQDGYAHLVSAVLSRLTRVSSVFFRDINCAQLSPALFSCFLTLCRTSTLEDVEFCNCQFPSGSSSSSMLQQVLTAAKTIRSLRLSYIGFLHDLHAAELRQEISGAPGTWEYTTTCGPTVPCKSPLYSLAIDANVAVLHGLFDSPPGAIVFAKLRRLYLSNVNDGGAVNQFLQRVGHDLDFLDLRLLPVRSSSLHDSSRSALIDLSYCPRLLHLRVSGLHWTPSICPATQLRQLFAKVADQLDFLHLMITVMRSKPVTLLTANPNPTTTSTTTNTTTSSSSRCGNELDSYYSDWNALDVGLSAAFPSLRNVQIDIKSIRQRHDVPSMLGSFPTLRSRGVDVQLACT